MAESAEDVTDQCSDISADSEVKNTQKIYKYFKCCPKKSFSTFLCKNCCGAYHDSCARKLVSKSGFSFLDGLFVKCCEADGSTYNLDKNAEAELDSKSCESLNIQLKEENFKMRYENQILSAEVNHLKQLLNEYKDNKERLIIEMEDKNSILKENNRFLMQRIAQIQNEFLETRDDKKQIKNNQNINTGYKENNLLTQTAALPINHLKQRNYSLRTQMSSNIKKKDVTYSMVTSAAHLQQMAPASSEQKTVRDYQNYTNDSQAEQEKLIDVVEPRNKRYSLTEQSNVNNQQKQTTTENQVDENGFKKVTYGKKRPRKNLGTAEISEEQSKNGFAGGERKVWLYIYRVNRVTTEEQILDYISNKPGFDKKTTNVEEIPSDIDQLKRFLVTAPLEKKDTMYQPQFWPKNVGVKRFNIEKNKKFLSERSGNFQMNTQLA